jgi:hypothetical protein
MAESMVVGALAWILNLVQDDSGVWWGGVLLYQCAFSSGVVGRLVARCSSVALVTCHSAPLRFSFSSGRPDQIGTWSPLQSTLP